MLGEFCPYQNCFQEQSPPLIPSSRAPNGTPGYPVAPAPTRPSCGSCATWNATRNTTWICAATPWCRPPWHDWSSPWGSSWASRTWCTAYPTPWLPRYSSRHARRTSSRFWRTSAWFRCVTAATRIVGRSYGTIGRSWGSRSWSSWGSSIGTRTIGATTICGGPRCPDGLGGER